MNVYPLLESNMQSKHEKSLVFNLIGTPKRSLIIDPYLYLPKTVKIQSYKLNHICSLHNVILGLTSLCIILENCSSARGWGKMVKAFRLWPLSVVNVCAPKYDADAWHCAVQVVNSQSLLVSSSSNDEDDNVLRSEGVKESIYVTAVHAFQVQSCVIIY